MQEGRSGIAEMRHLLTTGKWTKEELSTRTGLKLSTVSVQLSSHLKKKYDVEKSRGPSGQLVYSMTIKGIAIVEAPPVDEVEAPIDLPGLEADDVKHATDDDLKELEDLHADGAELPEHSTTWEHIPGTTGYRNKENDIEGVNIKDHLEAGDRSLDWYWLPKERKWRRK